MATIGTRNPTITDVTKRLDPDGRIDQIVELLKEREEILDDMTSVEGNLPTGHRITVRTGLPEPVERMLNQGYDADKSRTAQITEAITQFALRWAVDVDVAKLNGNSREFMMSEFEGILQGFNHKISETLFYGNNNTKPESIVGFSPRYSDLDAENAEMIIDAGGTGSDDNTSVWLVTWGPQTAFTVFPKGSTAGFREEELADDYEEDRDGKKFLAHRRDYKWDIGLVLKDWRAVSRIANINESNLSTDPQSDADDNLINQMIRASERIDDLNAGRPAFYVSRKIREWLRLQALHHKNARIGIEQVAGRKVVTFDEIPVRRVDSLLHTEDRVT